MAMRKIKAATIMVFVRGAGGGIRVPRPVDEMTGEGQTAEGDDEPFVR
jgi:hypothetical protein